MITATSSSLYIRHVSIWKKKLSLKNQRQFSVNCTCAFIKDFPGKWIQKESIFVLNTSFARCWLRIWAVVSSRTFPSILLGSPVQCWTVEMSEASVLLNVHLSLSVVPLPTAAPLCSCTLCLAYAAIILHAVLLAKVNNCTVCVSDAPALLSFYNPFKLISMSSLMFLSPFRLMKLCKSLCMGHCFQGRLFLMGSLQLLCLDPMEAHIVAQEEWQLHECTANENLNKAVNAYACTHAFSTQAHTHILVHILFPVQKSKFKSIFTWNISHIIW